MGDDSPRKEELLDRAYRYVLEHGLVDVSLRPLAGAIGSSPRVLLFLFGSKAGLIRELLARARADELDALRSIRGRTAGDDLASVAREVWRWLSAEEHRGVLELWVEAYGRSLVEPDGEWAGFGRSTVEDWLALLARAQPPARRRTQHGAAQRTFVLALLRGAMLDLLATADSARAMRAVELGLSGVSG